MDNWIFVRRPNGTARGLNLDRFERFFFFQPTDDKNQPEIKLWPAGRDENGENFVPETFRGKQAEAIYEHIRGNANDLTPVRFDGEEMVVEE